MLVPSQSAARLLAALVLAGSLAGCVAVDAPSAGTPGAGSVGPVEIPVLDLGHDHAAPDLHPAMAHGIREVSATKVAKDGHAGRMVVAGDRLLVSVTGQMGGFAVVDVADPRKPVLLGSYRSSYGAGEGEALAITPDGRFAFLGVETLYSRPAVPPAIEIVDLSDPKAPKLAARLPFPQQPHVFSYVEADGKGYLLVSDYQMTIAAAGVLRESSAVSAGLSVLEFDRATTTLRPLTRYTFSPSEKTPEPFFTHDAVVVQHPVTNERLVYLAAFGGGGRILSFKDPAAPKEMGATLDKGNAPVLRHHTFAPGPVLVDGALPTAAIPRSRASDGAAFLTLYDTADPTKPALLGEWRHPAEGLKPGDLPPLNLHVPVFAFEGTRLLVPHMHAGLYVFDVSSKAALEAPAPVAYWFPAAGEVPSGTPAVSVVMMAIEVGGVILATEAASGVLYALELDA